MKRQHRRKPDNFLLRKQDTALACMRSRVSLQVERVVEAFAAESAQVTFDVRMAFHVSTQETLQGEALQRE